MTSVLDTESSINICNSLQELQVGRRFGDGERFLNIGDERSVPILALKTVKLVFSSHIIVLSDYHYCPSFLLNVFFVDLLAMNRYEISIKNSYCDIIMNGVIVMNGQMNNGIYTLSRSVSVMYISNKYSRLDNISDV